MRKVFLSVMAIFLVIIFTSCVPVSKKQTGNQQKGETGTIVNQEPATEASTEIAKENDVISPGYYLQKDTYKFTFEKAALYDEIGDNEYFKDTPSDGKKYLVCFFEVENISDKDSYVNSLYIKAYLDDYAINTSAVMNGIDEYKSLGGDLQPGKKMKGFICFEVPTNWEKLEFTYTDGVFDGQVYSFVVTPDDIN